MNKYKVDIDFFKNLLFPLRCCLCNCLIETEGICASCWQKINWISEPKCKICGIPFVIPIEENQICVQCASNKPFFDKAVSVFAYDEFSKNVILRFKYGDETFLCKKLSELMYRVAALEIAKSDIIVPVPVYFTKRLERKYNQTELLACELGKLSNVYYEPRILQKIRKTAPQEGLSGAARRKNVVGSFRLNIEFENLIENKSVILVDDVFTTGATVNECSKVLKKGGAREVTVVTLAIVIP